MIRLSDLPKELEKIKQAHAPNDFRPALKAIDRYLADRVDESFQTRSSPDGRPWAGSATLVKSGGLFEAATAPGEIKGQSLVRKTNHKLARILQKGARRGGKKKKFKTKGSRGGVMSLIKAARIAQKAAKIAADIAAGRATPAAFAAIELLKSRPKRRRKQRRITRRKKLRIPPRPFEGITDRDAERIAAIVADQIVKGK